MTELQQQAVITYLTEKGFVRPEYNVFGGFNWSTGYSSDTKAELQYDTDNGFYVSTKCSSWTVDQAEDFIKQLTQATQYAKELNAILGVEVTGW